MSFSFPWWFCRGGAVHASHSSTLRGISWLSFCPHCVDFPHSGSHLCWLCCVWVWKYNVWQAQRTSPTQTLQTSPTQLLSSVNSVFVAIIAHTCDRWKGRAEVQVLLNWSFSERKCVRETTFDQHSPLGLGFFPITREFSCSISEQYKQPGCVFSLLKWVL